ncbi:hypothetical protein [Gilliamella apicola]|uniref:hypothetical protein n=1 Tax=Gilliamella apicola TaxID=1196095 RepID=UPI001642E3E4|nr:hypothetical protein [Gilliamella apicola]
MNKQSDFSDKGNYYPSTAKFVNADLIELNVDIQHKNDCLNLGLNVSLITEISKPKA